MKTTNGVRERARRISGQIWWVVAALTVLVTALSCRIQPSILENFSQRPWGFLFPALAIVGATGAKFALARNREFRAFLGSSVYLVGMIVSVAFGIYPMVLPGRNPAYSLTIENTQAGSHGLQVGLIWWVVGMALAGTYFVFMYRSSAGKVALKQDSHY